MQDLALIEKLLDVHFPFCYYKLISWIKPGIGSEIQLRKTLMRLVPIEEEALDDDRLFLSQKCNQL